VPIIFTRGGLSARGAGTFALIPTPTPTPPTPGPPPPPPPPGPVTQTVTFTSSGSWTAPSGVTSITNITIAGGVGVFTPGFWAYSTQTAVSNITTIPGPNVTPGPFTYAQAGAAADLVLASVNSSGTGERTASWPQLQLGINLLGGTPLYWTEQLGNNSALVRGLAERFSGPWDNRSSQIANGTGEFWFFGVEVYVPDSSTSGQPSSAFGYTVNGVGPNQQQNVVNFGSLGVTPGQTYSIQVGASDGYVQFQFLQA
jgi:hypothetical protein